MKDSKLLNIVFTKRAEAVSDFHIKGKVAACLLDLERALKAGVSWKIEVCNMLVLHSFRASYYSTHKHLRSHTNWWFEEELVDVDENLRCRSLWRHEVPNLIDEFLDVLLEPPG